jgi:hypothetical protein
MRAEVNPLPNVRLATPVESSNLGQGAAARAFDLASRSIRAGMDMPRIKAALRAQGYSDFAIQLFEPAIARLVRRGLLAPGRKRSRWIRPISAVRRWLMTETRASRLRRSAPGDLESRLHRQVARLGPL